MAPHGVPIIAKVCNCEAMQPVQRSQSGSQSGHPGEPSRSEGTQLTVIAILVAIIFVGLALFMLNVVSSSPPAPGAPVTG